LSHGIALEGERRSEENAAPNSDLIFFLFSCRRLTNTNKSATITKTKKIRELNIPFLLALHFPVKHLVDADCLIQPHGLYKNTAADSTVL
jgi:hypothetical protein